MGADNLLRQRMRVLAAQDELGALREALKRRRERVRLSRLRLHVAAPDRPVLVAETVGRPGPWRSGRPTSSGTTAAAPESA